MPLYSVVRCRDLSYCKEAGKGKYCGSRCAEEDLSRAALREVTRGVFGRTWAVVVPDSERRQRLTYFL